MDLIDSKNYVDKAEAVIKELIAEAKRSKRNPRNEEDYNILSTTQLRKQLAMTAEMFALAENDNTDQLSHELEDRIEYLRVQFVYQAGRDEYVKEFIEKAGILQILKTINGNKEDFITYCRYMEALVAFRKYHGNEDKER
ncbi:MAG: type III-A CRISPR-associated protein Csm2 [Oscillospiraceae bacterium]|nr:type III-A CRISPR-associated protein Csm2 [Oscillospiraceae bacterium]